MKTAPRLLFASLLGLATLVPTAQAGTALKPRQLHAHETAALRSSEDPFAPVYILTSRKTFDSGLQLIARQPAARRDSVGSDLVLAQIRAHQLSDVSHFVHEKQKRCGGYFAFASIADADAFLRTDATAKALASQFIASYNVDNQATVKPWLSQVAEANIRSTIAHLSSYPNRYYASSHGKTSAEWIRTKWLSLANGRSDVSAELFTACSNCSTQPSVILTIKGTELPNEVVVLGGHLDSISNSGSGETMAAPGADDDASGIASLTEVLRIALASGWKPKRTVKFMGYAAEEVGLRGSTAIAQSFKAQGVNVVGVLQLDMTNFRGAATVDMRVISDYSNAALQQFLRDIFDAYLAPLGMTRGTYTCGYGCSDHASWTAAGYPSAMMFEAANFPHLHTTSDTLAQVGNTATPSVALGKLGLAFLGELAKTAAAPNAAPVANFNVTSTGLTANFTDASTDSDGSIVARKWSFGDGTTSTAVNPSRAYTAAGNYSVTLAVTDDDGVSSSKVRVVTVTASRVLANGVPVDGLAATVGNALDFTLVVPTGSTNLKFDMGAGIGNPDLYVRLGAPPTDTMFTCRPMLAGSVESCTFPTPLAGTWYVRIKAGTSFSGVRLTGSYNGATGGTGVRTYGNTTPMAIPDLKTVTSSIAVAGRTGNASSTSKVAVNISHPRRGDLSLRLVAPNGMLFLLKPSSLSDQLANVVETYTVNLGGQALSGTWQLRIADGVAGGSGTLNQWSITF